VRGQRQKPMPKLSTGIFELLKPAREPRHNTMISKIVMSAQFEFVIGIVILVATCLAIIETDWAMSNINSTKPFSLLMAEILVTGAFTIELIARLAVHRSYYFRNDERMWNTFDFVLVVLGLFDLIVLESGRFSLDPNYMRTLRFLKVVRKLSRLVRLLRYFRELRLMMQCLAGSVSSLFWCFFMLAGFHVFYGILFVQQFAGYLNAYGSTLSSTQMTLVYRYFGSV